MNYLIDGHNLIGKIEDIRLSEQDDEAKLVLRLINWAAIGKNRRVVVAFDGGVHGTNWSRFESDRVKVVFVPKGKTADAFLIRFMRENVRNVKEFHLVTSDNAILKQADNRRIAFTRSDEFAAQLAAERRGMSAFTEEERRPSDRPLLKEHQVDAWLNLFGGEPEPMDVRPYRPKPKEVEPTPESQKPDQPADPADDNVLLSEFEVSEWLNLFGGEPTVITVSDASRQNKSRLGATSRSTKRLDRKPPANTPKAKPDSPLEQGDIDLFHSLFGSEE